jgi:type IV pilus assembly protein PilA
MKAMRTISKDGMKPLRLPRTRVESGFTLIELLVVILIIGILAAVAVPVFLNQRQKANDSAVVSDLKQAGMLIEGQGKFTGTIPTDYKASKGVTVTAMRTSERNNQITSSQFVDGNSGTWGTFVARQHLQQLPSRSSRMFQTAIKG